MSEEMRTETGTPEATGALLSVSGLSVEYRTDLETVYAVNDISLDLKEGETLGLVGETGAGKTTTALALLGLLPKRTAHVTGGQILCGGRDLLTCSEKEMLTVRGSEISMIFQDPMTALNPVLSVGRQIAEALELHNTGTMSAADISAKVDETLEMVGIPKERRDEYPYQFSGGMRQRVVIAMALICNPKILIADEPTTALDVTIQAQILSMICTLQRRYGTAVIMITHDLGVVAETCDKVAIMYAGRIVEYGTLEEIFGDGPHHPYTIGLFGSIPSLTDTKERLTPVEGLMPDPTIVPEGCAFAPRCKYATDLCRTTPPPAQTSGGHRIACHRAGEEALRGQLSQESAGAAAGSEAETAEASVKVSMAGSAADTAGTSGQGTAVRITENAAGPSGQRAAAEATASPAAAPLVEVRGLKKYFRLGSGAQLHAVDDVSFSIPEGHTIGVVGESGCGKSTLGRCLLRLHEPTAGQVLFEGRDVMSLSKKELQRERPKMQMIFQDPYASLNGRMNVRQLIAEPLIVNRVCRRREEIDARVEAMMDRVGLAQRLSGAYPHELDGGRRQRIGVARTLILEPRFVVCDEPVSALDVSIQAQILNLLMDLQEEMKLTYLFITHDLSVVRHISDEILVMYLGKCVESASAAELFAHPLHPYTRALLAAIPIPSVTSKHKERHLLQGEVTSPVNPAPGCRFAARCPLATDACRRADIAMTEPRPGHRVACLHAGE